MATANRARKCSIGSKANANVSRRMEAAACRPGKVRPADEPSGRVRSGTQARGEAWKRLSPEFKARHRAEKKAKDGELYWYGINRAADARAKVLASVLRIKHEHV